MGLAQEVRGLFNKDIAGGGVRVARYPVGLVGVGLLADGAGVGPYLYKAAGANVLVIVAPGVIANGTPFRLVWVELDTPLHVALFIVRLGIAAAAANAMAPILGEYQFDKLVAGSQNSIPIPFCATVVAGAAVNICGDLAVSTGVNETANVAVGVMTGMGT